MSDDETVVERRDATDLDTNDEVERTVDEMLQADDAEAEPAPEDGGADAGTGGRKAEETARESDDSEDVDPHEFDFEDQEWTLDERQEPTVFELRGMKFLLEEPDDDDAVLNKLDEVSEADRTAQMRALVQLVVAEPQITDERWEQMAFSAKLSLASRAAEFLGLDGGFLDE